MSSPDFMCRVLLIVALLPLASAAEGEAVRRFDFQPKGGALMQGFAEVPPDLQYAPEAGYGFVGEGENGWSAGEAYPDPLLGDWIKVGREFQVDVPRGTYQIRAYLRSCAQEPPHQSYSVTVNGRKLFERRITPESFYREYYKNEFTDWKPDDDIYDKYISPQCQPDIMEEDAPDGKLTIAISETLVFGLLIAPTKTAQAEASRIEKACRDYFKQNYCRRREHIEALPEPAPVEAQPISPRDCVLFARHYLEEVYPNTRPQPWEIRNEITAFASWGEFEPFAFSLHPFRDLKGVRVECSDFIGPQGAAIGRENTDVRVVRYKERKPYPGKQGLAFYTVAPEILLKTPAVDISRGVNRTFWITVHVPDGAAPGDYEATAAVRGDDMSPAAMKLRLRVLPIRLRYPEGRFHWTGAYPPRAYLLFEEQKRDKAEYYAHVRAELRDILDHGFTEYSYYSTWLPAPELEVEDGRLIGTDFSETKRMIEIYRKAGMPVPPIVMPLSDLARKLFPGQAVYRKCGHAKMFFYDQIPDFDLKLKEALAALVREAEKEAMPPIEISLADEPNGERLAPVLKDARLLASVPGITAVTSGLILESVGALAPFVGKLGSYGCDPRDLPPAAERHNAILIRDHGSARRNPGRMRFENGFWFYKSGFNAMRWWYNVERGDPYNTLDIPGDWEANLIYTTLEGPPNPTLDWEAAREGVDDCKYIHTLESMIEQCKSDQREAVRSACEAGRKALAHALGTVEVDEAYYAGVGSYYSADCYDKFRWRIAQAILAIDAALKGAPVQPPPSEKADTWRDPARHARVKFEVYSGPYERYETLVAAALPQGLGKVRLVEITNDESAETPFALRGDGKRIFWQLSGRTPSDSVRCFYAYGNMGEPAAAKSDAALEEEVDRFLVDDNLLANGSFEQDGPAGWTLHSKKGSPVDVVEGEACSGKRSLRCRVTGERNGASSEFVRLEPGRQYLLSCRTFLSRGSAGVVMWAGVWCYSKEGRSLERFMVTRRDTKRGWQLSAIRFTAPPDTDHAQATLSPADLKGEILFDDFRLSEYSLDKFQPPGVTVGQLEQVRR